MIASGNGYGAEGLSRPPPWTSRCRRCRVLERHQAPGPEPVKAGPAIADFLVASTLWCNRHGTLQATTDRRRLVCRGRDDGRVDSPAHVQPSAHNTVGSNRICAPATAMADSWSFPTTSTLYWDGGVAIPGCKRSALAGTGATSFEYPDLVTIPRFVDKSSRVKITLRSTRGSVQLTIKFTNKCSSIGWVAARVPSAPGQKSRRSHQRRTSSCTRDAQVEHPVYGRMLAMGSPLPGFAAMPAQALPATSLALTAERFSHSWRIEGSRFDELARAGTFGKGMKWIEQSTSGSG